MLQLKRPELFCSQCFVAGEWIEAADKSTFAVINPSTGQEIGHVPSLGAAEVQKAIDSAHEAWAEWKNLLPSQRASFLMKWYHLIEENKNDLAQILTYEQGKPVAESLGEIALGTSYIPWFAEECRRTYGRIIPAPRKGVRPTTQYHPVGVVCAITPWNFPSSLVARKAAPALAAGCPIIIKPASATPYSAIALAKLAEEAGIPKGVFSVVTGKASVIGHEIAVNPKVRKITFTGSTEIGKKIMAEGAVTMKRFSLELGGNAPFIVFDDADLDIAVNCAFGSKFRNAGQTCISSNRFLVQKGIVEKFVERYAEKFRTAVVGDGFEPNVIVGPMIDETALKNTESLIKDAVEKGAKIVVGGKRHARGGLFFEPTLLTNVTKEMRVYKEEIFALVAPIMTFETEEEAIKLANDTSVGLAAYLMTTNLGRAWRVSEALEYGLVGVNDAALAMAEVPFGGVKESGMGKEGAIEGLLDYMELRYTLMGGIGA